MKVSSPVMNTPYSRSENKAWKNQACTGIEFMTYAIPVQCLRLPSASSCRHPRMGARSTRFITLPTCSSRLSGSGNLQNCTYRPKLEKITMKSWKCMSVQASLNCHILIYLFLSLSFLFFCVLAVFLRKRNVASLLCKYFTYLAQWMERNRLDFSQLVEVVNVKLSHDKWETC